jgi:predicted lipoprotein with Yx(FWY)xxD motif
MHMHGMLIPLRRFRRPLGAVAIVGVLTLCVAAGALRFSPSAGADSTTCADTITSAPTGPATVSTETKTPFGKVLVIRGGTYDGCSLYLLTSDQLHGMTGSHYACSDNFNAIGQPCDTFLWPALLTKGAPIAGPGVKAKLLGTVTRTDLPGLGAVQQVTYAGMPLYRFFLDEDSDEVEGANLFDPVTSPTGIWYLVEPNRGNPAPGPAQLQLETAPVARGADQTVLSATMNEDFSLFPDASFPVYTLSRSHGADNGCDEMCAQYWPPVLTSGRPVAGSGADQHALGTKKRRDGTEQVTYKGKSLYLFADDAYIPGLPYGSAGINGAGADTIWGVFNTIPPSH